MAGAVSCALIRPRRLLYLALVTWAVHYRRMNRILWVAALLLTIALDSAGAQSTARTLPNQIDRCRTASACTSISAPPPQTELTHLTERERLMGAALLTALGLQSMSNDHEAQLKAGYCLGTRTAGDSASAALVRLLQSRVKEVDWCSAPPNGPRPWPPPGTVKRNIYIMSLTPAGDSVTASLMVVATSVRCTFVKDGTWWRAPTCVQTGAG